MVHREDLGLESVLLIMVARSGKHNLVHFSTEGAALKQIVCLEIGKENFQRPVRTEERKQKFVQSVFTQCLLRNRLKQSPSDTCKTRKMGAHDALFGMMQYD